MATKRAPDIGNEERTRDWQRGENQRLATRRAPAFGTRAPEIETRRELKIDYEEKTRRWIRGENQR